MGARILVIEDNRANLELMKYLLQAFGHETLTARDGEEGLELAARERPDLIICDVQLPVMNGYEVARRIKADPSLRDVPLIAVTAFAMVEDRQKALAAGFDGYFSKPISPETFVPQLRAFLGTEQSARAAFVSTAPAAPPQARSSRGLTVLVVDDKAVNLDLATAILESSGYEVVPAGTIAEALRLAREDAPDLILADVCNSDGSGYDFIAAVKADARLSAIPFVFLTSTMTSERDRERGLALGAARFLFRPIEPQDLLREIESCLGERGGA